MANDGAGKNYGGGNNCLRSLLCSTLDDDDYSVDLYNIVKYAHFFALYTTILTVMAWEILK